MKRTFTILLVLAMVISMVACGNTSNSSQNADDSDSKVENDSAQAPGADNPESPDSPQDDLIPDASETATPELETPEQTPGSRILVAYFSRVGNTIWEDGVDAVTSASLNIVDGEFAGNAQLLAQAVQQVTDGDLFLIQTEDTYPSDYRETTNQASVEQADNARPTLSAHIEDMDSYDTIVLIYPNWWGTLPQPLFTFLEGYDFSGKTILPRGQPHGEQRTRHCPADLSQLVGHPATAAVHFPGGI